MILPRFSIRTVLYLAVLVAVVAVVAGQAVQGATWAISVTIAIGSLAVGWVVYALFYVIVAGFARVALTSEVRSPPPAYYPETRKISSTTPPIESNSASPTPQDD